MQNEYDYGKLAACGIDVFVSRSVEVRRPHLVSIGSHVAIDTGFYCTTAASLGDYIHVGPYVSVIGGAEAKLVLRNFNTIGAGSRVLCATDEFLGQGIVGIGPAELRDNVRYGPVIFETFASIGTNVVIHPGVTLAEGSVVGSCSLVTKNTEPWTIYFGIPAKAIRKRPRERMIAAARALNYNI
jgi:acetyltransferase-like isoleucine patch superfamily enzyme